jgi:hypothetical protein
MFLDKLFKKKTDDTVPTAPTAQDTSAPLPTDSQPTQVEGTPTFETPAPSSETPVESAPTFEQPEAESTPSTDVEPVPAPEPNTGVPAPTDAPVDQPVEEPTQTPPPNQAL